MRFERNVRERPKIVSTKEPYLIDKITPTSPCILTFYFTRRDLHFVRPLSNLVSPFVPYRLVFT
jgi:hypothetical protein